MNFLIWDFDGTLAERKGHWSGALLEALDALKPGHGATADQIIPFLQTGFPWHAPNDVRDANIHPDEWWAALYPVFVRAFCEGLQFEDHQANQFCKRVREAYVNPKSWVLFDDTVPCLRTLTAAGWKHVILSNHVPELRQIVCALGIEPHFEAIFNSAETGVEKPNRKAFQNVIESVGKSRKLWMIGDSMTADVNGATSVGLQSALVRKPDADAGVCFQTLHELAQFLTKSDPLL